MDTVIARAPNAIAARDVGCDAHDDDDDVTHDSPRNPGMTTSGSSIVTATHAERALAPNDSKILARCAVGDARCNARVASMRDCAYGARGAFASASNMAAVCGAIATPIDATSTCASSLPMRTMSASRLPSRDHIIGSRADIDDSSVADISRTRTTVRAVLTSSLSSSTSSTSLSSSLLGIRTAFAMTVMRLKRVVHRAPPARVVT
mmetsp:Transcript_3598/g.12044  ORF Transcript_3598/g.12044 Transcript_3598/m.12044 type:complete len:206 (-) Transcript_3598:1659-2276(-)